MPSIESTPSQVAAVYARSREALDIIQNREARPLTLAEKNLFGHLDNPVEQELKAGEAYLQLRPDRVALQDATAQMALLQFMMTGREESAVPTTVHCDHLVRARAGATEDLEIAGEENKEVYDFLSNVSSRYGLGFWKPGAGIIHQTVLENYAFPGGLMLGTDSHTPNGGGLGMAAIGVGGADAADVMAGLAWEVLQPRILGVKLTGSLKGWAAPKDVILKLLGILSVKGGTNRIVEYFGEGTSSISCTGKATICNMGAELGATCSIFPWDTRMADYLSATGRADIAQLAEENSDLLTSDNNAPYDEVVEIDLTSLEPHLVGPHTPDLARPISEVADAVKNESYPDTIRYALIGSCTNSSYEDIGRAVDIALQAKDHGAPLASPLMISPGSEQIFETIRRDGQMETLESIGATVLANACGPCIGQWQREDIEEGERNSIVTSFNRNFKGRNDANTETLGFIGSPELVMALALGGRLSFNPIEDPIEGGGGESWRLRPPAPAPDIPPDGFVRSAAGYQAPSTGNRDRGISVSPESERLQLLQPFEPLPLEAYEDLALLIKTQGKTTTDQISPAGPWLRFRGHLDRISDNMLTGALNAFTGASGVTLNPLTKEAAPVPVVARALKASGQPWIVVGDENYGEGSSREHAAMSPRFLGCAAVVVRSFARIHETNLKKQGVLPFTFADPADWEKVCEDDALSIEGLGTLEPGSPVALRLQHTNGTETRCMLSHTLNREQISWWKAGSALNSLRQGS
ncbi:MAG TPA: aconitate hydratase [Planctomycetes bacterium]|nr:aconitate hydratase [Planctomycetota bacterium]